MQGQAYRCDNCGRIAFVMTTDDDDIPVPPAGWIGVSQVPYEGQEWEPAMHFCTWDCLNTTARTRLVVENDATDPNQPGVGGSDLPVEEPVG